MFNNSSKMLFIIILMSGTLITVSSNSWLSAWMGLEINLLSFIPLMNDNNNLMASETSLKYFLTQAIASIILLFSIILMALKFNIYNQMNFNLNFNFLNMIMLSSLCLKSGTAPFHFWFPMIMEGLSWINSFILMTWQKMAPLMLMSYLTLNNFFFFIILASVIFGALGGLNQTSLRKIMAFSSINHLGWMIAAMLFNESLWMLYYLIYIFLSMNLIILFNLFKIYHINQLFSIYFINKTMKFLFLMNFLSLGGLPPFLGFFPKWLVLESLTSMNQIVLLFIMIMMALVTLYFYLRICYSAFMLNYSETNWITSMNMNKFMLFYYITLSMISLLGLMFITLMFYIF